MAASPSIRNSLWTGRCRTVRTRCVWKAATARRTPTAIRERAKYGWARSDAGPGWRSRGSAPFTASIPRWAGCLQLRSGCTGRAGHRVVSLLPIAIGHAVSIALVAGARRWPAFALVLRAVRIGAGLLLIGWALYHWRFGHRHRVRFGMQVGLAGLGVWSFLMATAHGAGLMLWPVLMPLCLPGASEPFAIDAVPTACSRSASIPWRCWRHDSDCGRRLRMGRVGDPPSRLAQRRSDLDPALLVAGSLLLIG